MRTAYEELQISFREREKLEYSTRTTMESKIGELEENNNNLQGGECFEFRNENFLLNVYNVFSHLLQNFIVHDRKLKA